MTLKELEKRLKKEPDNLGLRVQVAGLMREAGRSTDAVELYRSVALAYRDQGRLQQAIAVCRSILEIAPDDVRCNALLSTLQGPPERPGSEITGTPVPAAGRPPTAPAPPPAAAARLPLEPPVRASPTQPPGNEPKRRSSLEETPLPRPVPHHVHDPTSKAHRVDPEDLDTNPNATPSRTKSGTGLAEAARRISGMIGGREDVSAGLDTRPVRRINSDELRKITQPPPIVETERASDDIITAVPGEEDEHTVPRERIDLDED